MSYIVTGGAGFIGSNMVRHLNGQGIRDVVIIDDYSNKKMRNIRDLQFTDYIDYRDGINAVRGELSEIPEIQVFFHIGANSDVLQYDEKRMMHENFEFSRAYFQFCCGREIPFIYASSSAVYGNSTVFKTGAEHERPHNTYSWSKWLFDRYVEANCPHADFKVHGFRFFNVFGRGESHKGKNACIASRFVSFIREKGYIDLFEEEISRDYVYVKDLCEVLYKTYTGSPVPSGIYNLGGGHSISHRRVAEMVVDSYFEHGILRGNKADFIKPVPMPKGLRNKFQFHTLAEDMPDYIQQITRGNEGKLKRYVDEIVDDGDPHCP